MGGKEMKIKYDKDADAAYIQLSSKKPEGGVEIREGVILHTTARDEIVGIEILEASKKFPVRNLYKLELSVVHRLTNHSLVIPCKQSAILSPARPFRMV